MEKQVYITEEERAKCQKGADALWHEWYNTTLYLTAKEMELGDILYEEVFSRLSKEKQSAIIGKKTDFANKAGITL